MCRAKKSALFRMNLTIRGFKMTIIAFNTLNAYPYGNALKATHSLRHQEFVSRQDYNVNVTRDGRQEFDNYDTPDTVYLVARDNHGRVLGTSRKFPTTRNYMIEDLWPNMIDGRLPKSPKIWESSRFCIDRNLDRQTRKQVKVELVMAGLEFGLLNNIDYFIGVMPPAIWRSVFTSTGWKVEPIGQLKKCVGEPDIIACKMPVSTKMLNSVKSQNAVSITINVQKETNNIEMEFEHAKTNAA